MEKKELKKVAKPLAGLWKKIHAVQTGAKSASQDVTVDMGGRRWKAASLDSILDVYLPLMQANGLIIVPVDQEIIEKVSLSNFLAKFTYSVIDVETGDSHQFPIYTSGVDGGDKAPGKAATYALKIAYLQLFSGRRGDDVDALTDGATMKQDKPKQQQEKPKQEKKEPTQEKKEEPKKEESKADKEEKRKAYDAGQAEIKAMHPMPDEEWGELPEVPDAKKYKEFTDGVIAKASDPVVKEYLREFALFWWLCHDVVGNNDLKKAEEHFASRKKDLSKANAAELAKMIAKRKQAEREASK